MAGFMDWLSGVMEAFGMDPADLDADALNAVFSDDAARAIEIVVLRP